MGAIAGAVATGAAAGAAAAGATAGCGKVSAALAVGGGATGVAGAAGTPDRADARLCSSWGAMAGTFASWSISGRPGTTGLGGGAGSAAAVALNVNAAEIAPAAAIIVVASNFPVRSMVFPIS